MATHTQLLHIHIQYASKKVVYHLTVPFKWRFTCIHVCIYACASMHCAPVLSCEVESGAGREQRDWRSLWMKSAKEQSVRRKIGGRVI